MLGLGLAWPALAADGAAPGGTAVVGDEVGASPELLPTEALPPAGRREVGYLNGRFLVLNMHGLLFHEDVEDVYENIRYASWMNAAVLKLAGRPITSPRHFRPASMSCVCSESNSLPPWVASRLIGGAAPLNPPLRKLPRVLM